MTDDYNLDKVSIFHVQDADRPMWVLAKTYEQALARWRTRMAFENKETVSEVLPPDGIYLVANATDTLP